MNLNKKRKHEYKKMYKDRNNNYGCEHLKSLLGAYFPASLCHILIAHSSSSLPQPPLFSVEGGG